MTDEPLPSTEQKQSSFAKQSEEADPGIIREFGEFLRDNKKWWLIPILIVLALLSLLLVWGEAVAPLIYPLF